MYANGFTKCFPPATASDIARLEQEFALRFPPQLRAHYLMYNGGSPDRKCWKEDGWEPTCLKRFLPIRGAGSEADPNIENTLQNALQDLVVDGPHIPEEAIPFAEDWGGNYFCVNKIDGSVFFFSMDSGDDFAKGKRQLAPSLLDFIENLEEAR
jgi:cell wall assembly regulator SMI1